MAFDPSVGSGRSPIGSTIIDFATHGISASALSAGISLANTAIALGNVFGGDFEKLDTLQVLQNFGADETADFYKDHKTGVDVVGFIAGSIVPGMTAIKALRAAQNTYSASAVATTGLRRALIPNSGMKGLVDAARVNGKRGAKAQLDETKLATIASGFHQQALEAAAFEGAVLLTLNQSPAISDKDLDYFEGISAGLGGAAFGLLFGTALGGTFQAVATLGAANKFIRGIELEAKKDLKVGSVGELGSIITGDAAIEPLKSYFQATSKIKKTADFEAFDLGRQSDIKATQRQAEENVRQFITDMTPGFEQKVRDKLWFRVSESTDVNRASNMLSGIARFTSVGDKDILFDLPLSQIRHVLKDDYIAFRMQAFGESQKEATRRAVKGNGVMANTFIDMSSTGGIRGVSRTKEAKDWDNIFTWRHETGHVLTLDPIRTLKERSKLGKRLMAEGEQLSRMARPRNWAEVDRINIKTELGFNLNRAEMRWLDYMQGSDELFADAQALLNDPLVDFASAENFPNMYKYLVGNRALAGEFKRGKSLMDVNTGETFTSAQTPTAADFGPKIIIDRKDVVFGEGERVRWDQKYNVDKLSWEEASALNSVAHIRKDIKKDMNVDWLDIPRLTAAKVQGIDIKVMQEGKQLTEGIDQALLRAKIKVGTDLTTKSNMVEPRGRGITSTGDRVEGTLSHGELARFLDTGEEFTKRISGMKEELDGIGTLTSKPGGVLDDTRDIPFWSAREGINPTDVNFVVVNADRRAVKDSKRLSGLVETQQRITLEREALEPIIADYLGKTYKNMPQAAYQSGYNLADNVTSVDNSTSLVASGNAALLSGPQLAGHIGKQLVEVDKAKALNVGNTFDSMKVSLAADEDAVVEAAVLDSKLRQQVSGNEYEFVPEKFDEFLVEEGIDALEENIQILNESGLFDSMFKEGRHTIWSQTIRKAFIKGLTRESDSDTLRELADGIMRTAGQELHTIENPGLGKFWRTMVHYNGEELVRHKNQLHTQLGGKGNINPKALYPGVADSRRYPHHALVSSKSDGIMSNKDMGMVVAHDANTLQQKINKIKQYYGDDVVISTDKQIEKHKKRLDEYDGTLLFRSSMMDSSLKRNGVAWDVMPEPNAGIFNQYTTDLNRQHKQLSRGMVEAKYSEEIGVLRQYSEHSDSFAQAKFGQSKVQRNAFRDTENLMLNKRPEDPEGLWNQINTVTENKISNAFYSVKGAVIQSLKTGDWEKMNETLKRYGMDEMYSEANKLILHNVAAPEPFLKRLTAQANSILGTMMLRMDFAHALVNVASLPIMLTSELSNLARLVSKDRLEILNNGASYIIPGSNTRIPNTGNLMLQATKNFFSRPELITKYKEAGYLNTILEEIAQAQKQFASTTGMKDGVKVESIFKKVLNTITAPSDFAEQYVKFVAANIADMTTDTLKITGNLKQSTISNFVSRVHGNYTASQRPDLFQGWVGQAIGLFQTYQFNLLQSLFSNVAAGNKTAVAKMIGLQAGIFGVQSVPGFQVLNEHIAERSLENNDFYKVSGELVGDTASNFLMYGAASSATIPFVGDGIDLYSRGDLTPRTPILIPTSASEIPAISIVGNFLNSVLSTAAKLGDGAPLIPSMLDGLGHSGFNRPIQGIAQLISGERTTRQGNLIATYRGWDVWNSITKVMGTKTLSEAVAVSSFYRTAAYSAYRSTELQDLGEAYKQTIRAGLDGSEEYFDFMRKYTERGGNIDNWNQWQMRQHSNATESQINKLRDRNNSPEGRYLMGVMGAEIEDYTTDFQ